MNALFDPDKLTDRESGYLTGGSDALADSAMLQATRMRRRQLGRMMIALDPQAAAKRVPSADYVVTRKIDGEFTCLFYRDGIAMTLNPGGTVRAGAPFHLEAARLLKAAGVKSAMLGGELYVQRTDGERPRVHDVVRVARAPKSEQEVAQLAFAVFAIYDLDGDDLSMQYANSMERAEQLFAGGERVHSVEREQAKDYNAISKIYRRWVIDESAEGLVLRSDSAGVFKLKPRHTIDLAIVGFSEGTDDRAGMLHSLLLAVVRTDGAFQIVGRVGGGFSDEERMELLKQLAKYVADSDYVEVNSDRVAYRMLKPSLVAEISCLDIISRTSHGGTIDRMVLDWNEDKQSWEGVRRLPLVSIISPQFVRLREDKEANPDDVRVQQLADITDIPQTDRSAQEVRLPASEILLHLTDYSPNRKSPLEHDIRVSASREQLDALFDQWSEKNFVSGWQVQE